MPWPKQVIAVESSQPAWDERVGYWLRPDTNDLFVIETETRGYVKRLHVGPGARVLDIGAHIGGATRRFVEAGADLVVAIEPDPDNFFLLKRNCPGGHIAIQAAVVADGSEKRTLWLNKGRGKNSHSLYHRRGRIGIEVPTASITDLVSEHRITHVKMDCEGSEYELLSPPLATSVRHLVVEFHSSPAWTESLYKVIELLKAQDFTPDRQMGSPAWNWVVGWHR